MFTIIVQLQLRKIVYFCLQQFHSVCSTRVSIDSCPQQAFNLLNVDLFEGFSVLHVYSPSSFVHQWNKYSTSEIEAFF